MRYKWLFTLLAFNTLTLMAQRQENPCVYEYLLREKNREGILKRYSAIYDFHKGDTLASIGAGSGSKEVVYSMMADSLLFYLQDIDSTCLTSKRIESTISLLYSAANRASTATFIASIGTEKETKLPIGFFDKIIIENTLHELAYPNDLFKSIRENMKPDGYLYVEDLIAKRPGQKHRGCHKRLFTETALIQLIEENGFSFVEVTTVFPNNLQDKVFKFSVNP